jgi:hypothetical protein
MGEPGKKVFKRTRREQQERLSKASICFSSETQYSNIILCQTKRINAVFRLNFRPPGNLQSSATYFLSPPKNSQQPQTQLKTTHLDPKNKCLKTFPKINSKEIVAKAQENSPMWIRNIHPKLITPLGQHPIIRQTNPPFRNQRRNTQHIRQRSQRRRNQRNGC